MPTEIAPALRAKVSGRNAFAVYAIPAEVLKKYLAADRIARARLAYRERADPGVITYGPRTRPESLIFKAWDAR